MKPDELFRLCISCARDVYGTRPPTEQYARNVARLLAGTALIESGLRDTGRMQYGNGPARGLWQTEMAAVSDSFGLLKRNRELADNAGAWLFRHGGVDILRLDEMSQAAMRNTIAGWDRFACLLCRLHYMRFPEPVPGNLCGQADYWKVCYNTYAGKGDPAEYMQRYMHVLQLEEWALKN